MAQVVRQPRPLDPDDQAETGWEGHVGQFGACGIQGDQGCVRDAQTSSSRGPWKSGTWNRRRAGGPGAAG